MGIDVGGTFVRAALVDARGRLLASRREELAKFPSADALIAWITGARDALAEACGTEPPEAVGAAVPGVLGRDRSVVVRSLNVPMLTGVAVAEVSARATGSTVFLFTDAEAAAWGEFAALEPRPAKFAHLRLGTGVALGVISEGRLQRLDASRTTHLDVLVFDRSERAAPCSCGLRGCLETFASGPALLARCRAAGFADLSALQARYVRGDVAAGNIVAAAAGAVSRVLDQIAERFAPELIAVGGGVLNHLPGLFVQIEAGWPEPVGAACLVRCQRGDTGGAIGAALLAHEAREGSGVLG